MKKYHYFLVSGSVLLKDVENIPDATNIPATTILYSTSRNIDFKCLTAMREGLEEGVKDVVGEGSYIGSIEKINYLGLMTKEEFNGEPEEVKIEPVKEPMGMNEITQMAEQFKEVLAKMEESIKLKG